MKATATMNFRQRKTRFNAVLAARRAINRLGMSLMSRTVSIYIGSPIIVNGDMVRDIGELR